MAVILPSLDTRLFGYATSYTDGNPPYNRYGKLYDSGVKVSRNLLFNQQYEQTLPDDYLPTVLFMLNTDFVEYQRIVSQTQSNSDPSAYRVVWKPLEPELVDMLKKGGLQWEAGTPLYRIVKFPISVSDVNALIDLPFNANVNEVLQNFRPRDGYEAATMPTDYNGQYIHPLSSYFTYPDKGIEVFDANGKLIDVRGLVVVSEITNATLETPPQDSGLYDTNAQVVQSSVPSEVGYTERLNSIRQLLASVSQDTLTTVTDAVKRFMADVSSDTSITQSSKMALMQAIQQMLPLLQQAMYIADSGTAAIPPSQPDTQETPEPQTVESDYSDAIDSAINVFLNTVNRADNSGIYTRFALDTDMVENVAKAKTRGMWSGNVDSLTAYYTSSAQSSDSKQYYYTVMNEVSDSCDAHKQFDVAFGHINGSGSLQYHSRTDNSPSKTVYSQLQMLCLGDTSASFEFNSGVYSSYVYAILLDRSLFKDRVDAGNWQLTLMNLQTGSRVYHLIDDSGDSDDYYMMLNRKASVYNIVSGTIWDGRHEPSQRNWGRFYPDHGVLILDGAILDSSCSFNTNLSENVSGDNAYKLFVSISGSAVATGSRSVTHSFDARSYEQETIQTYFVRATKDMYNYSNNPTWVSGSNGDFKYTEYSVSPTSYITSIGLYDDSYRLLAVGKFPTALRKSNQDDYVFTVRVKMV